MKTTVVYEYYTSRHDPNRGVSHWPVIIVTGEDGVEDIMIRPDSFVEVRYVNGDYDLVPTAKIHTIKVRNGGYPAVQEFK